MADMPMSFYQEDPQPPVMVVCTHINAYGRNITVSTINRDSSAMSCPGRYAETLVFDNDTEPRKIVDQGEAAEGSRKEHDRLVIKWSRETIGEEY